MRTQIENGEAGSSVRAKLNTLFNRINETFVPETGIQLDCDTWYDPYPKSGALEITIAA